jgi:hypothetical protein
MQLDSEPRERASGWMRTFALALAIGGGLLLLDLGFMAILKLIARVLR